MRAWVMAVLVGLLVAACGSSPETNDAAPGADTQAASCPDASSIESGFLEVGPEAQAPLSDDVVPTGILSCRVDARDIPGEGRWTVLVEAWADTGLERFVATLRSPDEESTSGVCGAIYIPTPWFALVAADGSVVHARVPRDACHHPQQVALDAFAALPFVVVKEIRLRQLETPGAQASGCPQQWKDMIAITAGDGRPPTAEEPVLPYEVPAKVKVCVYTSVGAPADEAAGQFVAGSTLKGARLEAALAGVEAAPPAEGCERQSTTFAVVMPDGGNTLTVELDGCRRMLTAEDELRQAPGALVAALR